MSMPSQHYGRGSANSIHFFQQIQSQDLQHEEIRIQRSFVERYWKGVSNPITLSLPNGSLWKMFWVKRGEDIWLQKKNWKTFARSLRCGDVLFFKYKGEGSEFKVKIFDDTSLEIDYSGMRREDSDDDDDDECVEITNDGTKTSTQVKEEKNDNSTQEQTNSKRKINLDDVDDDTLQNVLAAKKAKKCSNTGAVKERAENSHSIDDQYPGFQISMGKSYLESTFMMIPTHFTREHMKGWEGKAIIRAAHDMSTCWEMSIKNSSTDERSLLGSGWKKFAQNYNLQVNDICKFVMTQRDPMSFIVTIPHVKVQPCPQKLQDSSGDLNDGVKVNTFKITITTTQCQHIPHKFMKSHSRCHGTVKLKFGETSWFVKLIYYEQACAGRFYKGWTNFVKECDLKIGDTCLFELIDEENHVFNVTRLN